jgi:hypothetical protein
MHILFSGTVGNPHRGELCYVARAAFPSPATLAVRLDDIDRL